MSFENRSYLLDGASSEFVKLESLEAQKYFDSMSNALEDNLSKEILRSPDKMSLIKQLKEEAELIRQELEEIKKES